MASIFSYTHSGHQRTGQLRVLGLGPEKRGRKTGKDGGELRRVCAGNAIQLASQRAADGRVVLLRAVLDHGYWIAGQPHAQVRRAEGLRKHAGGLVAEGIS